MKIPEVPPVNSLVSSNTVVPVVSAIDANYAPVYSVFLESLLSHVTDSHTYDCIVLTDNVPQETVCAFQAQVQAYPNVHVRAVDMTDYPIPFLDKVCIKKAAFFRLVLPHMLLEYDRAVYLDTDTILLDDVAKLYDSLEEGYAAAVPDITMLAYNNSPQITEEYLGKYQNMSNYWNECLKLPDSVKNSYFNSGVLVMNLEFMRDNSIVDVIWELLLDGRYIFSDQDALNIAFNGNITSLSTRWNFFQCLNPKLQYFDSMLQEREQAGQNIGLIHYAWKKPWSVAEFIPYEEYFWYYSRRSVFHEHLWAMKQQAGAQPAFMSRLRGKITSFPLVQQMKQRFPNIYALCRSCLRRGQHD